MSNIPDTSAWQGTIPVVAFKSFAAFGIKETMHKIGGGDDGIYHDGHHDQNVKNARAAGLIAHRYFFNGSDPTKAAKQVAAWLKGTGSVGLAKGERFAWDIEGNAWSDAQVHTATVTLKAAGQATPAFYASASMLSKYPQAKADGCALWVAQYGSNSGQPEGSPYIGPWSSFWLWQYTSNGTLPGFSGRIDLSTTDGKGTSGGTVTVVSGGNITTRATKALQAQLIKKGFPVGSTGADGVYGPATTAAVKKYQASVKITADGIYGPVTDSHLFGKAAPAASTKTATKAPAYPLPAGSFFGPRAGSAKSVSGYFSHQTDLRKWQQRMKDRGWILGVDGLYGPQTESVTKAFQKEKKLAVDGLIGKATWAAAWTAPIT